jgi:hypothetical protein
MNFEIHLRNKQYSFSFENKKKHKKEKDKKKIPEMNIFALLFKTKSSMNGDCELSTNTEQEKLFKINQKLN